MQLLFLSPLTSSQQCPVAAIHQRPGFGDQTLRASSVRGGFPFGAAANGHTGINAPEGQFVRTQGFRTRYCHEIEDIAQQLEPLVLKFCGLRGFMKMWILPVRRYSIETGRSPVPNHSHVVARYNACQRQFRVVCKQAYSVQHLAMAKDHLVPAHQLLPRQYIRP